jgi:hypothetical protein
MCLVKIRGQRGQYRHFVARRELVQSKQLLHFLGFGLKALSEFLRRRIQKFHRAQAPLQTPEHSLL